MKILQICNFSSGISGVWTRVLEDSPEFILRGHEVHVFSSDETEQGLKVEEKQEVLRGIKIKRFPVKRKKGYAVWFDFEKEAIELKPDIIICHGLRKPYLGPAIKVAKEIGAKCFLVTHAPFIDKELRENKLNITIWFYDKFVGRKIMNSFDKVIAICKWEKEDLIKLGCDEERIVYIPNSLADDFFNQPESLGEKKILFMGRMHPVKEIELLIEAFNDSGLKEYIVEIVSSLNGDYYDNLSKYAGEKIIFTDAIYEMHSKIKKIDSSEIFVLPSKKESLPFGIIEAMARGKIVIATKTKGAVELIRDRENGFLFDIGNKEQLKELLNEVGNMTKENKMMMSVEAFRTAYDFKVSEVMNKWDGLFK